MSASDSATHPPNDLQFPLEDLPDLRSERYVDYFAHELYKSRQRYCHKKERVTNGTTQAHTAVHDGANRASTSPIEDYLADLMNWQNREEKWKYNSIFCKGFAPGKEHITDTWFSEYKEEMAIDHDKEFMVIANHKSYDARSYYLSQKLADAAKITITETSRSDMSAKPWQMHMHPSAGMAFAHCMIIPRQRIHNVIAPDVDNVFLDKLKNYFHSTWSEPWKRERIVDKAIEIAVEEADRFYRKHMPVDPMMDEKKLTQIKVEHEELKRVIKEDGAAMKIQYMDLEQNLRKVSTGANDRKNLPIESAYKVNDQEKPAAKEWIRPHNPKSLTGKSAD